MSEENILEGKKILWIEDDQFLGGLVSKKLTSKGASLIYVKDGEQALSAMENDVPDVVLSDVLLPGTDGFGVLEKMKSDERLKNVPVVFFSNLNTREDVERGLKLGAFKFLVKSNIIPDEIPAIVVEALNSK